MFAPGAETVKERTIHTAIGVALLRRRDRCRRGSESARAASSHRAVRQLPARGDAESARAQHARSAQQPAGTGDRDYQAMDLRQPKGFVSYFTKARDYDGVFDFVPRAARPKVGRPHFPMKLAPQLRCRRRPGAGCTSSTTMPDGSSTCRRSHGQDGSDDRIGCSKRRGRKACSIGRTAPCRAHDAHWAGRPMCTGRDQRDGHDAPWHPRLRPRPGADPRTPQGRSALYSLAFMLRRAAAVYLDIQDYELKAGIRSQERPGSARS